ncbi:MAG: type VI secretion system contractile sheath large subunit, partial [Desulfobacterales bacterium]
MSPERYNRTHTSRLAAALTALATLRPGDETTRMAILEVLGFRPVETTEAMAVDRAHSAPEYAGDDKDMDRRRPNLRVISSTDHLPPVVPSSLTSYHEEEDAEDAPSWLDDAPTIALPDAVSDPFSGPLDPLLAPNYSRAIISRMAAQQLPIGEIDLEAIIRRTERSLPFQNVPRCLLPSLARGVQLLIDTHAAMQPFGLDVRHLIGGILRTVGWDRVEVLRFKGCPAWGVQRRPIQVDDRYLPPAAGRPVLIISDLGIGAGETTGAVPGMAVWNDFIGRLKRTGTPATLLIPYGPNHWPEKMPDDATIVVWDRTTTASSLGRHHRTAPSVSSQHRPLAVIHPRLASAHPNAVRLAIAASLATRIEPQLLRRLRLGLADDLDVGAEARLWHSDLVQERAPTGIVISPAIRNLLQHRLAQMPQMLDTTYAIIREVHQRSSPALQLEEELAYYTLKGNTDRARSLLQSMVATLVSPERDGIARWAGQAVLRIPHELRDYEETRLLAAGAALRLGDSSPLADLPGGSGGNLHWLMPQRRETEIAVNLRQGAVEFGPRTMTASHRMQVPDLPTILIELAWLDEDDRRQNLFLRLQPVQRRIYEIKSDTLDLTVVGGRRYRLAVAEAKRQRSSQKFMGRNRPPRVHITYDVETNDEVRRVELPFVIGVLADLSGAGADTLPDVEERRFVDIDADNFDARMAAVQPWTRLYVPDVMDDLNREMLVELTFPNLAHFSPETVLEQIPSLQTLKAQRGHIAELIPVMDEVPVVRQNIEQILGYLESPGTEVKGYSAEMAANEDRERIAKTFNNILNELKQHTGREHSQYDTIQNALQALADLSYLIFGKIFETPVDAVNALLQQIDERLSIQLSTILHHPEFQKLEAAWRGLYYLVANTESGDQLKIRCFNVSKRDLHKALSQYSGTRWQESFIFKQIYNERFDRMGGEPFGCLVGDYYFDHRLRDVSLLGDIARIAALAHVPFLAGAAPAVMGMTSWSELVHPAELQKLFQRADYAAWNALRDSEDAGYVGLAMPRFLARLPYGASTNPVQAFAFEEAVDSGDAETFSWCNSAYAMAANIARAFNLYGWCARIRGVESGGAVEAMPVYTFRTDDEEVDVKCPTEIAISDRREAELSRLGFIPLVHRKNSDIAAFFGAQSLQRPIDYDDPDAYANAVLATRLPYRFACCRFVHYLQCIIRDINVGSSMERRGIEILLQKWLQQYVDPDPSNSSEALKARHPLAAADVRIHETEEGEEHFNCDLYVKPHYQLEGLTISLRTRFRLPKPK